MAPIKTIQIRTNYVPGLSLETKELQKERSLAQERAALTNDPDDWRIFRSIRNKTTASVRRDKRNWEAKKFSDDSISSGDIWKSVKGYLGWNTGGTPSQLLYNGRIISRPAGLAKCMNDFFIDKIKRLETKDSNG